MVWKSVLIQLIEWVIVECLYVQWVGKPCEGLGLGGNVFRLLGGEFCDSHRFGDAESRVVPLDSNGLFDKALQLSLGPRHVGEGMTLFCLSSFR